MSLPRKWLERSYSGPRSTAFWDRVAALPEEDKDYLYRQGVALQNLEGQVLQALFGAEERVAKAKVVLTPRDLHRKLAKRVKG